jgi:hypothetical protein
MNYEKLLELITPFKDDKEVMGGRVKVHLGETLIEVNLVQDLESGELMFVPAPE